MWTRATQFRGRVSIEEVYRVSPRREVFGGDAGGAAA